MTALDKKGELRSQFYLGTQRKAGKRISDFCTRFRTVVADLKSEGVLLPSAELGWFLKDKIGLDPLRKQLLDTALQGAEDYNVVEAEILHCSRSSICQIPCIVRWTSLALHRAHRLHRP